MEILSQFVDKVKQLPGHFSDSRFTANVIAIHGLVVVGMNSIAMYCMSQLMKPWIRQTLQTHYATLQDVFGLPAIFEGVYGPIWLFSATLAVLWLICLWLYRRKIFIRI